jgi:hypothetical protein
LIDAALDPLRRHDGAIITPLLTPVKLIVDRACSRLPFAFLTEP